MKRVVAGAFVVCFLFLIAKGLPYLAQEYPILVDIVGYSVIGLLGMLFLFAVGLAILGFGDDA